MATRLTDFGMFSHLWSTPSSVALLDERAVLQRWLDIGAALARTHAELGVIPAAAADVIGRAAVVEALDLELVAEQTRRSSHSLLGLIRGLTEVLPESAARYIYFGATVQDVTDTWFGLLMRDAGRAVAADLYVTEGLLLQLADRHRLTAMIGRTHGQPGAPMTFGLKVASWADEIRRHLDRLAQGESRWAVGQLAGAVGTLSFYPPLGLAVRQRFCTELGLRDPGISWTSSRDRVAEFGGVLALVTGTLARLGDEVYELARPEIGELREASNPEVVGSITMPHKRNPERSEHLSTLARLARASAGVLAEGVVSQHERDGRSWKAEWVALPELCHLAATAANLGRTLVSGLEVDVQRMSLNVVVFADQLTSQDRLADLSASLGRYEAQRVLQAEYQQEVDPGTLRRGAGPETAPPAVAEGSECVAMVDTLIDRARRARLAQPAPVGEPA